MSGHDSTDRDLPLRVRQIIAELVADGTGSPDVNVVAEAMGTSVRTLQRRLRAAGLTYAGVLQQTRFSAARQMLEDGGLKIGSIARTLGYSDHGHFTRAFQRWAGLTPRDFRQRR